MVGVFVAMKWRVLRNSLRGTQLAGMISGGLLGLLMAGLVVFAALAIPDPDTASAVLAAVYALWLLGWILGPLFTGGGDETLRPEHFALSPLNGRKLAAGLFAANLLGVPALVGFAVFAATAFYGLRFGLLAGAVGAVFAVLTLTLVILIGRVALALFGTALRSRWGKEFGYALLFVVCLGCAALAAVLKSVDLTLMRDSLSEVVTVLGALPSGWGLLAVRAAAHGDWAVLASLLVAAAVLLAVLGQVWAKLIDRRRRVPATANPVRGHRRSLVRRVLPGGPSGAVAEKELRAWQRDARRRMVLISGIGMALVSGLNLSVAAGFIGLPYLALLLVVLGAQSPNFYGMDGTSLWHTLVTPGAERADVRGRQLAWALIVGPVGLLLALVLPALSEAGAYPWVLAFVPALLGAGSGVVVLQAVYAPIPFPDPRYSTSAFPRPAQHPGCGVQLRQLGIWALQLVAVVPALPLLIVGTVADLPVLRWLGVPVGIATGAVLARWWGEVAVRRLRSEGPELLQLLRSQSTRRPAPQLGKQTFLKT